MKRGSMGVPVKIIGFHYEGCMIFDSLSDAARHIGRSVMTISLHLHNGKVIDGWSFNYYVE